jgi:hypothetical protein
MTFSIREKNITNVYNKNYSVPQISSFFVHNRQLSYYLSGDMDIASIVELKVFGLNGQLVKTIVRNNQFTGKYYTMDIDQFKNQGRMIPAGKYFCKLLSSGNSALIPLVIY